MTIIETMGAEIQAEAAADGYPLTDRICNMSARAALRAVKPEDVSDDMIAQAMAAHYRTLKAGGLPSEAWRNALAIAFSRAAIQAGGK